MLITIVTSTLNCADRLEDTAKSIRGQTYRNIQWIVADGGSRDGTLGVISGNSDAISISFSEADHGIYDAWNKACKFIRGDWVIFLGAGDIFCELTTLESIAMMLLEVDQNVFIAYGNVIQKRNGKETYRYGRVELNEWEIYRPKLPAHQGVFQKASLFQRPPFDASYQIVADSKFMFMTLQNGSALFLDIDVCQMEPGGVSSNPKYALKVMNEFFRLENDLGYKIPILKKILYILITYMKVILYHVIRSRTTITVSILGLKIKRFLALSFNRNVSK